MKKKSRVKINKHNIVEVSFVDTKFSRMSLMDYLIREVPKKREGISIFRHIIERVY